MKSIVTSHAFKATALLMFAVVWWIGYSKINAFNAKADRAIFFSMRPVDYWGEIIQPASAIVYVAGAAILFAWPIAVTWNSPRIWRLIRRIATGTVVGFLIFLLWPLNIRRPEFDGHRFGESLMQAVFAVDDSANCFPSFHCFFAVLGAMVIQQNVTSKIWVAVAWLIACGVLISTIMTGQHYLVDVLGGSTLAFLCVRFFE